MEIVVSFKIDGEEVSKQTMMVEANGEKSANSYSMYARFFDDECFPKWRKDAVFNNMFLVQQQRYANDLLKSRGHLFLNEVYDMLGMTRTKVGQLVGWVYDEQNPIGDNHVDFGIYNNLEANLNFINGWDSTILLDFNVDGFILDKID